MDMAVVNIGVIKQHLIDPEICIRCNTCEATCPVQAITHDARNYVVDAGKCDGCNACIAPCPTGAIDNWRQVPSVRPYTIAEQLAWDALPVQATIEDAPVDASALPAEIAAITSIASQGQGGVAPPPWSAAHPYVNLHTLAKPAKATVSGNFRLTGENASADVRHIVLDFGATAFPVLEGQTIGIVRQLSMLPVGQGGTQAMHRLHLLASTT